MPQSPSIRGSSNHSPKKSNSLEYREFTNQKSNSHRVNEKERIGEDVEHGLNTVLDLLFSRNTRRVNIIDTGANLVGVAVVLEGVKEFHVSLGSLDRDNISVEALDGWEDIIEVRVAEVGVSLEGVANTSGGKLEGVNGPLEVSIPVSTTERKLVEIMLIIEDMENNLIHTPSRMAGSSTWIA